VTAPSIADGRSARAARTREAVVDALLALIEEGNPRPTAREIADRAGVSLRSVYVHFDDLEDLFTAAAARHFDRMVEHISPLPTDGPLAARLDALIEQRSRLLERSAAVRRAAVIQEPFSPTLARVLGMYRKAGREQLERVLAPELARVSVADRRLLLASLDVATGPNAWETLRTYDNLSADEARAVVTRMVTALLAGHDG